MRVGRRGTSPLDPEPADPAVRDGAPGVAPRCPPAVPPRQAGSVITWSNVRKITVAFATAAHAHRGMAFMAESLELHASAVAGGDGPSMACVDVELAELDLGRFWTLLAGVHGLVVSEGADVETRIA